MSYMVAIYVFVIYINFYYRYSTYINCIRIFYKKLIIIKYNIPHFAVLTLVNVTYTGTCS